MRYFIAVLVVIILFLAFTAPSVSEIGTALVCTQSNGEVVCVEN